MIHESLVGSFVGDLVGGVGDFLGSEIGQVGLDIARNQGWIPGGRGPARSRPAPARPQLRSVMPIGLPEPGFDVLGEALTGPGRGGLIAGPAAAPGFGRSVLPDPFGGRFVEMASDRALKMWDRARNMPTQASDVITIDQADDREVAKLAVKHGIIPADSDLGQMLQMGGATVTDRNVRMSDGSVIKMRVVSTKGSKTRKRRNYNTVAGRRNAARTMTQMGQQLRTYKRLAKLGAQIDRQMSPKASKAKCCPPKRKKAC